MFSGYDADGLVMGWVKFGASSGVDCDDFVALHRAFELAKRCFSTFTDLFWRGGLDGKTGF